MRKRLLLASAAALIATVSLTQAQEEENAPLLSPDKKWAYRVIEEEAVLVRAGSDEVVLKLSEEGGPLAAETGEVLWAPDSRRIAFNSRAGGRYYTCAVFELAGAEWKQLPDLETNAAQIEKLIERAEQRDRKRLGVGKDAHRRRIMDEWRVRRWIDADTFELFARSSGTVLVGKDEELESIGGTVLATVRCDNKGSWDFKRLRELSDAEVEALQEKADDARVSRGR